MLWEVGTHRTVATGRKNQGTTCDSVMYQRWKSAVGVYDMSAFLIGCQVCAGRRLWHMHFSEGRQASTWRGGP